ncbi:MAG: hypothetical protein JJU45_15535 [Acidimicrobiia bacterium]|nr:hypothetical protein [Acidimicrobiia bacterium]
MSDEGVSSSADPGRLRIDPPASDEEAAAIAAAVAVVTSSASGGVASDDDVPRWRFSGRWWTKPVPARRVRP